MAKETVITNITEYIKWVNELGDGDFLYRGQADKEWPLRSGAARRICGEKETDIIDYSKIETYINDLLKSVKNRELDKHNHDYTLDCDLKILAELQHFGAATTLLDFSKDSLIALWMACSDELKKDGKVFALNRDQENFKRISHEQLNKSFKFSDAMKLSSDGQKTDGGQEVINNLKYNYWTWEPSHFNKRIPAQSSIFLLAREKYILTFKVAIISKKYKNTLLKQLENLSNLTEESIYPDFPGFAKANGPSKDYIKKDAEYYYKLGNKYQQQQEYQEAIKNYNKAIELNKKFYSAYMQRGYSQERLSKYREAIINYDKAIDLDPKDDYAYYCRGYTNERLEQYREAIIDYDKAIQLNHNYILAYCFRGNSKRKLGQHKEALIDYDKAIELDTKDNFAYSCRGNCKKELGQYEEAIIDYDKAIELDPKDNFAYSWRGDCKEELGKYEEAIVDYDKAIELDPKDDFAYRCRGDNKYKLGQYEEAIIDYDKAIELSPKDAFIYFKRGHSKLGLKQHEEAREDLLKAKELAKEQKDTEGLEAIENSLQILDDAENDNKAENKNIIL